MEEIVMLILPFLLLQAAEPVGSAVPVPSRPAEISAMDEGLADSMVTVTGRSLRSTAASLEQCLARQCPPAEDIAASMEHAENQLIAGQFKGARKTLIKSRSRNKRYAESLPREVSGLLQFDADVASLLGMPDYGRIATFDSIDALKAGLPADDPAISFKRLAVADVFLRQGKYSTAVHMYDAVARRAEESGWSEVQGAAMFRSLRFYALAASVNPAYAYESRKRFAALRATTDPATKPMRDAALALTVKLRLISDKHADVDKIMQELAEVKMATPVLIYAPPVQFGAGSSAEMLYVTPTLSKDQWVDFDYLIAQDGTVRDVAIAAQAPKVNADVLALMQSSLEGRRYVPLDVPADSAGMARRERLMLVADTAPVTGTRLNIKAGLPKLMTMDLTSKVKARP
ncbi:MAG: hypothetical protein DI555_02415 [Novosphingobium pentaromativorans]|uniref:Uncharacterized protein n=1 Tax=Novosphingobium pentaromativorans TaxID=205844 RepID=A0A2W5NYL9_9SPHN|nr:MAG: hypothetical protein DI555_02415 [Novosphingobium pentaromativorans]